MRSYHGRWVIAFLIAASIVSSQEAGAAASPRTSRNVQTATTGAETVSHAARSKFFNPNPWTIVDVVTVVGLPLALVALLAARVQLRDGKQAAEQARAIAADVKVVVQETRGVATATRDAVERTERHLADNHLLLLLPALVQLRRSIDSAVRLNQAEPLIDYFSDWLEISSEGHEILVRRGTDDSGLHGRLEQTAKIVSKAKDAVVESEASMFDSTRRARSRISEDCSLASAILGRMKAYTATKEEGP